MSFSRIKYDKCAYDLQLERSTDPGLYRLYPGYVENCNKCYPMHGPTNGKEQVSTTRNDCEDGLGSLAAIESELTNRVLPHDECNKRGKNQNYKNFKTYHKPTCNNHLEGQDTRFTHPLDSYRGMSLYDLHLDPYLHVNPQDFIQCDGHRNGLSSRLVVRDKFTAPKQTMLDHGEALPPKPKKPVRSKSCRVNCD